MEEAIAILLPINKELFELGMKVGKIYTDFGLPIDMALDKLPYGKREKAQVLFGAQNWLIQHRRDSNATDKAIERQRRANREAMYRFLKTGESGVY
jgi:hypothetical protein